MGRLRGGPGASMETIGNRAAPAEAVSGIPIARPCPYLDLATGENIKTPVT